MNREVLILVFLVLFMVIVSGKTVNLSEMTTEKKIAQMFIVRGDVFYEKYLEMEIGGYFLDQQDTKEEYKSLIKKYNKSKIKPYFSTDMEGAWNPFVKFYDSLTFRQISNASEAYKLGKSHADILKSMGFDLDFSPVVEMNNEVMIWPDRCFTGNKTEVKAKVKSYIKGLEENGVMACAKHYPGGSMIKNPHFFRVRVDEKNLERDMFDGPIKQNVSMIMVGHTIFTSMQSTVSRGLVQELKHKYDGIVITDDITMMGLANSYIFTEKRMFRDLIVAGNDIILWTGMSGFHHPTPEKVERKIKYLSKSVELGKINMTQIDNSVEKILKSKGYKVVS